MFHCHRFWKCYKALMFCSLLTRFTIPCACQAKRHLNLQEWSEPLVFLTFWPKCASRHNGVHFFEISTSKSDPVLVCFVHFDFEMCFTPQRRALFRNLNFQKWSRPGVFCTFWLRNVLHATTACTFSTSQLPKMVRTCGVLTFWLRNMLRATTACTFSTSQFPKVLPTWGVFSFFTCKCASRHKGVQFFISHLASWLRTRRFSEPTFQPSGATNHWKNTVFRDFPTFSCICIFFLLTLSLCSSLLFSDSSHLCFSSVHIVGSLTSKFPSAISI